ncbi:MAG: DNA-3-methyladenine glycosylase I [Chloroflexi bacterium]|nr:DNA-3-methyladenine glycosylase I [Chloroflexota bacterium]
MTEPSTLYRCAWAGADPLMIAYHDEEWGVPCHDDGQLFERLMLEGFQAGLSWSTILRKRENFRRAFDDWDPFRIAAYGPADSERLMADDGIVRNRLKIAAAVQNARAFLDVRQEFGSFDTYAWSFTGGGPLEQPIPLSLGDIPTVTPEAQTLSKALKRRGFTFVGPTICYAFMQSVGMVNDHVRDCFVRSRGC